MKPFKMFYIGSDHGVLEREDLALFHELGIEVQASGLYEDPQNPNNEHGMRAPLPYSANPELYAQYKKLNPDRKIHTRVNTSKEFINNFDLIFVNHCCPYPLHVYDNWENIKHKPVVWRTYTQQNSAVEALTQRFRFQGLKILRISPKDRTIPNYAGDDAVIRSYMDPGVYKDWNGSAGTVVTFNNYFSQRSAVSNTDIYLRIRDKFPGIFKLFGGYNKDCPISEGYVTWEEQIKLYREAGVYFALGSKPASLTYNFMEAMLTGTPVVTWGPKLGNFLESPDWKNTYEVPDLFENGVHCFYSDSENELVDIIRELLSNKKLAQKISKNARQKAIEIWDKKIIVKQWEDFFSSIL